MNAPVIQYNDAGPQPLQRQIVQEYFDDNEDDLPEPPDNFDEWNSLPDDCRERVTNQFTRGIDNEHELMRDRVQREYATARARHTETVEMRNERALRREQRQQRGQFRGRR